MREGLSKDTTERCKALTSRALLTGGGRTRRLGELICQYLDKEASLLKEHPIMKQKGKIKKKIGEEINRQKGGERFGELTQKWYFCGQNN